MALLSVQNVSKTFKDHDYRVHAVRNASLEVHRGEMIAIIGPSGSGKTTLLNLMGIVVAPDSGEVYVDGQKASDMSDAVRCRINEATIRKYIQDQERDDIAMDRLSVKEYEDPFVRKSAP